MNIENYVVHIYNAETGKAIAISFKALAKILTKITDESLEEEEKK